MLLSWPGPLVWWREVSGYRERLQAAANKLQRSVPSIRGRSHMLLWRDPAAVLHCCDPRQRPLTGLKVFVLWAPALVVFSLLFGPFWFTPFAFRTTVVMVRMCSFVDMIAWAGGSCDKCDNRM